ISLDLDRRLGEREDRDGDSSDRGGSSDRAPAVLDLAGRRREQLVALMKIADPKAPTKGLEPAAVSAARPRGANESREAEEQLPEQPLARAWGDLLRAAREDHEKILGELREGGQESAQDLHAYA